MGLHKVRNARSPYFTSKVGGVTFTVGAEATNVITVTVQATDGNGHNLAERVALQFYLSTDAEGDNLTASAPSSGIAAGASGVVIETIADKAGLLVTNSSGEAKVAITEASTPTFYLVVVLPDGSLTVSGAITFA